MNNRWLRKVLAYLTTVWITQFQSFSLCHSASTGHPTCQDCSSPPCHSRHLVVTDGTTCEVAPQPRPRPLLPRCTISTAEVQPRCRSGPQRWPLPCKLWCLCPHQGPGCTLVSSPGHRSSLGGSPGASGTAGRRRWQWGQSGVLQCRYLKEKCKLPHQWRNNAVYL